MEGIEDVEPAVYLVATAVLLGVLGYVVYELLHRWWGKAVVIALIGVLVAGAVVMLVPAVLLARCLPKPGPESFRGS